MKNFLNISLLLACALYLHAIQNVSASRERENSGALILNGIMDVLGPCPPKFKLSYFDFRGRAESLRMILAACGQKYEDFRIKNDVWPSIRENFTFNQVCLFL